MRAVEEKLGVILGGVMLLPRIISEFKVLI